MSPLVRFRGLPPQGTTALVHRPIVEEHAEEAAFQWLRRSTAVRSPAYKLTDLARLDERVEANLEGLAVAGELGLEVTRAMLEVGEEGELFAAAACALARGASLAPSIDLACANPGLARAFVSAMGWGGWRQSGVVAAALLASADASRIVLGLDVHRIVGRDPGLALAAHLHSRNAAVSAQAALLVGELGLLAHARTLELGLGAPQPGLHIVMAWSLCRLSKTHRSAMSTLAATLAQTPTLLAADMLARVLPRNAALDLVRSLCRREVRLGLLAGAAAGFSELADELVRLMRDPALARLAGFAFSQITGADLERLDLDGAPPADGERAEQDDPDADLPWPDPAKVASFWERSRKDFAPQTRYLGGRPMDAAGLAQVLRDGTQPQRRAAALELGWLRPGKPLFNPSRPGFDQARELLGWGP